MEGSGERKKSKGVINTILLLAAVAVLTLLPYYVASGANFTGTDDAAAKAVSEINGAYRPWIKPIFGAMGKNSESFFFTLQAAIGAAVIGYGLGYMRGKSKGQSLNQEGDTEKSTGKGGDTGDQY